MSASDRQRQRDRELVLLGMAIGSRQVASQVRADWLETADVRDTVVALQKLQGADGAAELAHRLRCLGLDWDQVSGLAAGLVSQMEWLHLMRDAALAAKMLAVLARGDSPDPVRAKGYAERIERVANGKS